MPKGYIARLVYDRLHLSIVKGYGAHLMVHLKDYVRALYPVIHYFTYAGNYTTGGTLMRCLMLPRIRYLEVGPMLLNKKDKNNVVHQPPQQWTNVTITPIDPLSISAIKATGWSPSTDELAREPRHGPYFNELQRFLSQIQFHKQAWPFISPVNRDEVPDYYNRLTQDLYAMPRDLVSDLKLIFKKCRQYNNASTVYSKCAVRLEKYIWSLIEEIPEWFELLEEQ
ncbi:Bromodomain-containing protein [Daldinia bambusicola]|nr:Bromodomain-containing protein [Daldinia bambusicola]